jgi:hypothetical protein
MTRPEGGDRPANTLIGLDRFRIVWAGQQDGVLQKVLPTEAAMDTSTVADAPLLLSIPHRLKQEAETET